MFLALPLVALAGCLGAPEPDRAVDLDPAASVSRGAVSYQNYCVACHGRDGTGDGPYAAQLPVPVADLTGLSADNGGTFPHARVMAQIHGYPGRYQGQVMPEFGPLLAGETVQWRDADGTMVPTPRALVDLVNYLETIQDG
ncbi:c-type cytochrome [Roseovarius salinarum]|uniref:c-type cytochrome n=1 Tax=Roseovarius salinarum TaxID=1981892 RepID=UPI001E63A2CE|nr:c-type cytochrome [Roseovarius salinarum]